MAYRRTTHESVFIGPQRRTATACCAYLCRRSSPDKTYTSFRRSSGAATAARAPHSLATQLIGCTMSSDGSATTGGCRDASGGHVTFIAQCVRGSTVVVAQAIAAEFDDVLADYGATTLTVPPHAYAKEGPKLDNSKPSDPSMASSKKRGRRFPKVALSEHYDDALPKRKGEGTEGTYRVALPDSCARIRLIQANQRFSLLAFTVDPCSAALKGGDGNHNWHAATREVARRMYRLRGIDDFYVLVGSWVGMGVMKGYLDQLEELVRPLPNVCSLCVCRSCCLPVCRSAGENTSSLRPRAGCLAHGLSRRQRQRYVPCLRRSKRLARVPFPPYRPPHWKCLFRYTPALPSEFGPLPARDRGVHDG